MPDIVGRFRAPRLSAAPASPAVGEMYYDTGVNKLYWWNGSIWFDATGGGGGSSWVSALSAQTVLDTGVAGQIRAGRTITTADFTAMGLQAPLAIWGLGLTDGGGGNTANDRSGNGRNLVNKPGSSKGPVNLGGVGINALGNTSAGFSGDTGQTLYISDIGTSDPFRIATGSFGCWVMTINQSAPQGLIGKNGAWAAATANWYLVIDSNQHPTLYNSDGTNWPGFASSTPVCDGRWHFIVATMDGTTGRIYIDGVLDCSGPLVLASTAMAVPVNVGSRSGDGATACADPNFGYIDEAFVTADVLTDDQVRYLYCASVPHTLGKAPTAVSLSVRRCRKGAPFVVSDFGGVAPLRLYNFTGGSAADQGSNGVPLLPVATKLGSPSSGYASSPRLTGASSGNVSVPAAGIPVGATIVVFGYQLGSANVGRSAPDQLSDSPAGPELEGIAGPGITDSQHNTWVQRAGSGGYGMGGTSGIFVFDCQVTTALVSGNVITYTDPSNGGPFIFQAVWFTQCYFDAISTVAFSGTAANGGTITTQPGGGPVLGVFAVYNGANGSPTPSLGSSGQGPGYSSETSTFASDFSTTPYMVHSLLWEDKIGAGGVAETATGTLNDGGTQRFGATIAYTSPLSALATLAPGADGAQNGAVVFNGSSSLAVTDAGLPTPDSGSMTYGCWMNTSKLAVMGVMGWAGASGNGERIITLSDGTLRFDEGSLTTQGPFIADGRWHFVVSVLNTAVPYARRQFYVDGRLVGSTTNYASASLGGANGFRIGAVQDGTSPFTGAIDGVFVYPYPMATSQIVQLYAKGSLAFPPASQDPGAHVEAIDASNVYAVFDTLESQHQIDLLVGA